MICLGVGSPLGSRTLVNRVGFSRREIVDGLIASLLRWSDDEGFSRGRARTRPTAVTMEKANANWDLRRVGAKLGPSTRRQTDGLRYGCRRSCQSAVVWCDVSVTPPSARRPRVCPHRQARRTRATSHEESRAQAGTRPEKKTMEGTEYSSTGSNDSCNGRTLLLASNFYRRASLLAFADL